MSDSLQHECGIAYVRLRKPLEWYEQRHGSPLYGFHQLFLLMEKQHNRGQDGAGIGCVKLNRPLGENFMFRDREISAQGLTHIFSRQLRDYNEKLREGLIDPAQPDTVKKHFDFGGELLLGHLRYGTSGNFDSSSCHPYFRRSIWPTRNLLLAGNFNITNSRELNERLVDRGAHPIFSTDTQSILEEIGFWLDEEHNGIYHELRDKGVDGRDMPAEISRRLDVGRVLRNAAKHWDGGYAVCGLIGNGDSFIFRDPNGIRPCYYIANDEVIAVASERSALMTIFNQTKCQVEELPPGAALIVKADGSWTVEQILDARAKTHCSFERIYFSRGNDPEIYEERKALGAALAPAICTAIDNDFSKAVISFIPNTAEIAYYGLMSELRRIRRTEVKRKLLKAAEAGTLDEAMLDRVIMDNWPRGEKVIHKDIKLRTFISQEKSRMQLASHVYDISYGAVTDDNILVCLDDSIVRGTTLRQSILRILSRPNPKKIVIVSTAPQIRYPDCYGIDMSEMGKFLAFQAAVALARETGKGYVLDEIYRDCLAQAGRPASEMKNHVRRLYELFTDEEISAKCAELVYPAKGEWKGVLTLIFQKVEDMRKALPTAKGDWYFTGDYPTPGGYATLNRAFMNYHEKREGRAY